MSRRSILLLLLLLPPLHLALWHCGGSGTCPRLTPSPWRSTRSRCSGRQAAATCCTLSGCCASGASLAANDGWSAVSAARSGRASAGLHTAAATPAVHTSSVARGAPSSATRRRRKSSEPSSPPSKPTSSSSGASASSRCESKWSIVMGSHGIALYTGRITLSLTAVGAAVVDVPSAGRGEVEAAASPTPGSSHIAARRARR